MWESNRDEDEVLCKGGEAHSILDGDEKERLMGETQCTYKGGGNEGD